MPSNPSNGIDRQPRCEGSSGAEVGAVAEREHRRRGRISVGCGKDEQDRLVGLAEAQGWLAEVQSDGSVVTRHPIDWMVHLDYPSGYTKMTRDPHEPLECMKCGARYVNHIQHTKWHDTLAQIING